MTLNYELDLDRAKVNHRADLSTAVGQKSFRSKVIARTNTHAQTAVPGPQSGRKLYVDV